MNNTYRSIWNESLGAWVAASELCTARGRKSSRSVLAAGLLAAVVCGGASSAWAANECGVVASGGTVTCQGDGTPVGDANPNTTGIAYGTDNIKVVVDGTAAPFTIAPVNNHGVYSTGSGAGDQQIEVNGPVAINVTAPPGNTGASPFAAVLAEVRGGNGNASAVISGAQLTSVGEFASGVTSVAYGDGNATSILNSGAISSTGQQGSAVGLYANTRGSGTATVIVNGGSISTGTGPANGSHAAYALAYGNGDAVATMTGGVATTQALNNSVVVAQTLGAGDAYATISGGTATTNGASSTVIAVGSGSGDAMASQTGGTVIANGADGAGLAALAIGTGDATASMTGGSIATQGSNGYGIWAAVLNSASTAAATATMDAAASTVTTQQTAGFGLYARNDGSGAATATLLNGRVSTAGTGAYGLYAEARGTGDAVARSSAGTDIQTSGAEGAKGILANALGTGNATATNNGSVRTTGAASLDGNFGVYAVAASGNATAANTGTVTTSGTFGYGVYAAANGNGIATATSSGAVTTQGPYATGLGAHVDNFDASKHGTANATLQSGGTVTTTGSPYGIGIFADVFGYGDAVATNNGTVSTQGQFAQGTTARVLYGAGNASAVNQGALSTTGIAANGVYAAVGQGATGNADALNTGTVMTTGDSAAGVVASVETTGSTSIATATMSSGAVSTSGANSHGVYALNSGLDAATAKLEGGTVTTTANDANGVSARIASAANTATATASMLGGSIGTAGTRANALHAETLGLGSTDVTMANGAVSTSGGFADGIFSRVNNNVATGSATATLSGGTIATTGFAGHGILVANLGSGSADATVSGGTVATAGDNAYGALSQVSSTTSVATATTTLQNGSVTTTGALAHAVYAHTDGAGVAAVRVSGGVAAASGANADGVRAWSNQGTYAVDVTGGTVTGGTAQSAAIHTLSLSGGGGTVDVGSAAVVDGASSGIAIRDGDTGNTGVDAIGGNAVVTTAGTVTGDAILGLGNDSFALTGGRFSGSVYGDDRVASATDGNDSFRWTGGALTGGFYGQNGSDIALVSAAAYNGSTVLDGGDDVAVADGWVDRLTLQGVTATAGGAQLLNWESITLDGTRLTLAGDPLVVGAGLDAGGALLGLFINPTSTVRMGTSAFSITGDVHNAGAIDLRNPSGVAGNVLTVRGNYTGSNGLVQIHTALGNDTSATDKLVVNGNTSGTTRLQVTNTGGTGGLTTNGIQVVQVTGTSSDGNFALASPVQAGAYEYALYRGGRTDGDANSFYLNSLYVPPPTPVEPVPGPAPAPEVLRPAVPGYVLGQVASNELGLGLLGTLHQRVGEQQTFKWDHCGCDDKPSNDQVWARLHAQRLDIDGKRQFGSEQDMQYVQFGKDLSIAYSGDPGDKSRTHTGLSMGYGRTTTEFGDRRRDAAGMGDDTGKMKGQMATLGAYHTRYADNGSYLDLVGQLHAVHNKYTDTYGGEGTQKGAGFGLSAEVGRPWQIGDSQWLIEPQAQLSYQATRYKGFSDKVSSVDGFTGESLRARLGGRLAWNDKADRSDKLVRTNTFYVTANLLHEFKDPETVSVGGTSVTEDWARKTWAEIGVGAQLPLGKSTYLYGGLQYQRSLSDSSREGVSGQVGVRLAW